MEANATPAKAFFIRMITKDISLEDCILDLLDNSIDSARGMSTGSSLAEFEASITFGLDSFVIEDNCGGISIADAQDYAFHFGRRRDADNGHHHTIGLYGIGMKRAIFKIGSDISIRSSTTTESFELSVNVPEWEQADAWNFPLQAEPVAPKPGTRVEVSSLNLGVRESFGDAAFVSGLSRMIARDYTIFLQAGFRVKVNDVSVEPRRFFLRTSSDFEPARIAYTDGDVRVEVSAGMAALPPDDDSAQAIQMGVEDNGWYVLCNDRVVLAADKSERTVWGDEGFQRWHPQYNGFLGIVAFRAETPASLPWTTTKREIDSESPLYRRALVKMKDLTRPFIDYTNQRKADLDSARAYERSAKPVPVERLELRPSMRVPHIGEAVDVINIQYPKERGLVEKAAKALGNPKLSARQVGSSTFDYFLRHEVED